MNYRIQLIQKLIDINEKLIFYPRLKSFYNQFLTSPSLTILDVGSNKGQSIDFFISLNQNARIFAFEPNPALYSFLCNRYKHNSNISIYPVGVSDMEGKLKFQENILDETSSFEELNFESEYLKRKARILGVNTQEMIVRSYQVDVITLHSFLKRNPALKIDVLKIDVEGHELNALKGLFFDPETDYHFKYIQLESHTDDMYMNNGRHEEISNLLSIHGFKLAKRIRHGFGKFYELIYKNT